MQESNTLTVTIGIPAHNEEASIGRLLQALLDQRMGGRYSLEKIIVTTDGCTDKTEPIVREYAAQDGRVTLHSDGQRIGKAQRLNRLYEMNESDILITLDADMTFKDDALLEALIAPLDNPAIAAVAGNDRPLPGRTFMEKVINTREAWWYEARKNFNGGDSIYNSAGRCYALRKDFIKNFRYLPGTLHDWQIIYLEILKQRKKLAFAEAAHFFFREAASWQEVAIRARRYEYQDDISGYNFPFTVRDVPRMPFLRKARSAIHSFSRLPFYTFCSILLVIALKIILLWKKENMTHLSGLWQVTESSKQLL